MIPATACNALHPHSPTRARNRCFMHTPPFHQVLQGSRRVSLSRRSAPYQIYATYCDALCFLFAMRLASFCYAGARIYVEIACIMTHDKHTYMPNNPHQFLRSSTSILPHNPPQFLRSSTCTLPRARLYTLKQPTPNFYAAPHPYFHMLACTLLKQPTPASRQLHIGNAACRKRASV